VPSSSSSARSAPRRATNTYAPPTPLEDLHILDYLELAGSQYKAARALEMHQTTVCRSLQLMQRQFSLINAPGSAICRHGHNLCLHHLRLAYREHRLMAEQLRIGSDVLHHALLITMAGVQEVPPRFRSAEHWVELLRHGLLDGAIRLQLVAQAGHKRSVLLPRKGAMPLLHHVVEEHGYAVEQQPAGAAGRAAAPERAALVAPAATCCGKPRRTTLPAAPASPGDEAENDAGSAWNPGLIRVSEPARWLQSAVPRRTLD
jgi:hypothetical protein